MKTHLQMTLILLAGFGLSVAIAQSSHAQAVPPTAQKSGTSTGKGSPVPEELSPTFEAQQTRRKLFEKEMAQPSGFPHDATSHPVSFSACPGAPQEKCAQWSHGLVGECDMLNPEIKVRPDGTASWHASVKSYEDDNAYCTTLIFRDRNNVVLWTFARMCSQTLVYQYHPWPRNDLGVPRHLFNDIANIYRKDHC